MSPPCLIYLSTSAGVHTGCHYLFSLSVCVTLVVFTELYAAIFHKPGIYGSGRVWANAWDVFRPVPSRGGRGRRVAVDFVVCFGWGGFFRVFFFDVCFLRTHTACCKYEAALPHLPLF